MGNADTQPGLLSLAEAAEKFGIATRTAYDWYEAGVFETLNPPIHVITVRGTRRVRAAEIERFLAAQ